jgi:PAS domain-containing protein
MFNSLSTYYSIWTIVQHLIIGAGGLATAILAIWGIWAKILKPWLKESREKRETLFKAIGHIEGISEKLEKVSQELQPNGGGSIKDQIKQIANDIKIIRVERDATFYLSKEPSFKSDGKGYYTSINYALSQLVGVSESELLGLGWLNYVALEDKDRIWEEWENIIESGKEISLFYGIKNPTTMEVISVKCRAVINRDNNKILSVIGTIEPTEKKHSKKLKIA